LRAVGSVAKLRGGGRSAVRVPIIVNGGPANASGGLRFVAVRAEAVEWLRPAVGHEDGVDLRDSGSLIEGRQVVAALVRRRRCAGRRDQVVLIIDARIDGVDADRVC